MSTSHTHVCVSDHNHFWAWQFYSFPLFLQSSKVKRTPQDSINNHWPALTVTSCKGLTWPLVRSLYLLNELHHSNYTKNLHGQHGTTCIIITYLRNCRWWILSCKVDVSGPLLRKTPYGLILLATTFHMQPLNLRILGGHLWDVWLHFIKI